MTNFNQVVLSGQVEWFKKKERAIRGSSSGLNALFKTINCRIGLPKFEFDLHGEHLTVMSPMIWASIALNQETSKLPCISDKMKDHSYIFIAGGKITNWTRTSKAPADEGAPIPTLEFSLNISCKDISLSKREYPLTNSCTFSGVVKHLDPNGKMRIACWYHNPKSIEKKLSLRLIPIVYPGSFDPSLLEESVFVTGKICGKRPDNSEGIYVVAEELIRLG